MFFFIVEIALLTIAVVVVFCNINCVMTHNRLNLYERSCDIQSKITIKLPLNQCQTDSARAIALNEPVDHLSNNSIIWNSEYF